MNFYFNYFSHIGGESILIEDWGLRTLANVFSWKSWLWGDEQESLLQPSKIAHFIGVFGLFRYKKTLFLGLVLPRFGSFLWILSFTVYFVMCCYRVVYGILCKGWIFRAPSVPFRFLVSYLCYYLKRVAVRRNNGAILPIFEDTFAPRMRDLWMWWNKKNIGVR